MFAPRVPRLFAPQAGKRGTVVSKLLSQIGEIKRQLSGRRPKAKGKCKSKGKGKAVPKVRAKTKAKAASTAWS